MTDPAARIAPITPAEQTDEIRAMFSVMAGVGKDKAEDSPVLKTFARHPKLTHPFLQFNRHLLFTSTLPDRVRQIAILRVAWLRQSRFLWASHLRHSLIFGFTEADFDAVKVGSASPHWSEAERVFVDATDQFVIHSDLDDKGWDALASHLSQQQVMDMIFTIGAYMLLATAFNAMRIERDAGHIELAARYGSP